MWELLGKVCQEVKEHMMRRHVCVQVRFERGTVATPELLQDVELPSSVSVLGQPIDLTSLKV